MKQMFVNVDSAKMILLETYLLIIQDADLRSYRKLKLIQIQLAADLGISKSFNEILGWYKCDIEDRELNKKSCFAKASKKELETLDLNLKLFKIHTKSFDEIQKINDEEEMKIIEGYNK